MRPAAFVRSRSGVGHRHPSGGNRPRQTSLRSSFRASPYIDRDALAELIDGCVHRIHRVVEGSFAGDHRVRVLAQMNEVCEIAEGLGHGSGQPCKRARDHSAKEREPGGSAHIPPRNQQRLQDHERPPPTERFLQPGAARHCPPHLDVGTAIGRGATRAEPARSLHRAASDARAPRSAAPLVETRRPRKTCGASVNLRAVFTCGS